MSASALAHGLSCGPQVHRCAVHLVEAGAASHPRAIEVASAEIAKACDTTPQIASLALQAVIARLLPAEPPARPEDARLANPADHQQHGPAPSTCWDCGWTTWWKAGARADRWLCARCWEPTLAGIVWLEAPEAAIRDSLRSPQWTTTPERDGYLLLRLRQVARDAARVAADLLGAWRPPTPRLIADLRTIDWHGITDSAAIVAAAEELRGWALENAPLVRVIARRALGEVLGWPAVAVPPALDRALDLLHRLSPETAVGRLGSRWPTEVSPGSPTPVPIEVDQNKTALLPAHPHLLLLLDALAAASRNAPSQQHICDVPAAPARRA